SDQFENVGDARNVLSAFGRHGVDPEDVWALQEETPIYSVQLCWSGPGANDCFDLLMQRRGPSPFPADSDTAPPFSIEDPRKALGAYANNPLRAITDRSLGLQIRSFLQSKLPDYMVPTSLVLLDSFPLAPNGKLDRDALPAQDSSRSTAEAPFVAPRT